MDLMLVHKFGYVLLTSALIALTGCGEKAAVISSFPMGQKVQVGKIVYSVLEAEWRTDVPGGKQPPKNRVLQIHLSVTNSGAEEISVPMLRLHDAAGKAGRLEIRYLDLDHLDRLLDRLLDRPS